MDANSRKPGGGWDRLISTATLAATLYLVWLEHPAAVRDDLHRVSIHLALTVAGAMFVAWVVGTAWRTACRLGPCGELLQLLGVWLFVGGFLYFLIRTNSLLPAWVPWLGTVTPDPAHPYLSQLGAFGVLLVLMFKVTRPLWSPLAERAAAAVAVRLFPPTASAPAGGDAAWPSDCIGDDAPILGDWRPEDRAYDDGLVEDGADVGDATFGFDHWRPPDIQRKPRRGAEDGVVGDNAFTSDNRGPTDSDG